MTRGLHCLGLTGDAGAWRFLTQLIPTTIRKGSPTLGAEGIEIQLQTTGNHSLSPERKVIKFHLKGKLSTKRLQLNQSFTGWRPYG
ncbi:hypothetical protein [Tateyamaria sp.]|uniref:hypothetical protein n=1 Tax=Tateyamaria sp. TaxID=1929288 RepID=UPI0032A00E98